ncbi:ankyrin repeat domain-containing protein [Candidatus Reidiella endopervernicosa]|uniref:Ankyrin repeat domain-containing protein n=1 Tax=Candidatus Reidiella endopervernicosa TaxID=2738883 RepID=A0A6N0HUA8_9GAMM|nr:ankyrin repeat domain-containing protein [Candidatus Reidiella endopervernicosa]QKQ25797.1 ankyrin repeat domain-containing protein [Candidatus Reidiella endopervernicosa]
MESNDWSDVRGLLRYMAEMFPFDQNDPFVAKEIDINARIPGGDTPLHLACQWDDQLAIRLLIEAGAEVNAVGDMESTPLHEAAMFASREAVELLLSCGASKASVNTFADRHG